MVNPLNHHYALENPASIYDEEALTALELAGRTTAKVNECVTQVNKIPEKVAQDVLDHINKGAFDRQIDKHTQAVINRVDNTEARLDNLLGQVTPGSTTMDAEVIDGRVDVWGNTHGSVGTAIREATKRNRNICIGVLNPLSGGALVFDTNAMTVTAKSYVYIGEKGLITCSGSTIPFEPMNGTYMYVLDSVTTQLYKEECARALRHINDVVLCYVYAPTAGNIHIWGHPKFMEMVYINSNVYGFDPTVDIPSNIIGVGDGARVVIDTQAKTISMPKGYFFFDQAKAGFVTGSDALTVNYGTWEHWDPNFGGTARVVVDAWNNLTIRRLHETLEGDRLIFQLWVNADLSFGRDRIYMSPVLRDVTYLDGELLGAKAGTGAYNKHTANIFKKVVCCGDSYTSGYMVDKDGVVHDPMVDYAWPHYMEKITGNTYVNCGSGGANVLTWQTVSRGLPKAQSSGKAQAYIIGLQLNDSSGDEFRGVPLGNKADIGTNNTTYYAGLSKVIRRVNEISPKAKIFVQTTPYYGGVVESYNQAVLDVVDAYKNTYPVHVLDLRKYYDAYQVPSLTGDAVGGHFTALGYEQFAEILNEALSDYINNHPTSFQDVALIEYD